MTCGHMFFRLQEVSDSLSLNYSFRYEVGKEILYVTNTDVCALGKSVKYLFCASI